MEKIVQTAGRDALGDFAPEFAHFNDDVLSLQMTFRFRLRQYPLLKHSELRRM